MPKDPLSYTLNPFPLTCLLRVFLLARFSLMDQLCALEIHFKRQSGKVCAVGNSEQGFRNSANCFPHQALVLLRISYELRHIHLGKSVANVVVQKSKFQGSPDGALAGLFERNCRQANDD